MLERVLAVAAPAVFLVRLVPQPLRLARTGVDDGVSPMAAFNQLLSEGAWLTYGLVQARVAIWLVSAFALFPSGAAAFGTAIVVAWSAGWLGAVLGASVLLTTGPQVVEALRTDDLSGIAPATWWISILDAALWGAYGWVIGDLALVGYWAVLTACAVTVLARLAWTATRRRTGDI